MFESITCPVEEFTERHLSLLKFLVHTAGQVTTRSIMSNNHFTENKSTLTWLTDLYSFSLDFDYQRGDP